MPNMKLWTIDDGAQHTIIAEDAAGAFAEYIRMIVYTGLDWPDEEPSCKEIDREQPVTVDLGNGLCVVTGEGEAASYNKPRLTAAEWCRMITAPQYLACSEY